MGIKQRFISTFSTASIRLTEERWNHIVKRHPEMVNYEPLISKTINNPDEVYIDDSKSYILIKRWSRDEFITDWLIAYITIKSETDGFVKSLHGTSNKLLKKRKKKWQQVKLR